MAGEIAGAGTGILQWQANNNAAGPHAKTGMELVKQEVLASAIWQTLSVVDERILLNWYLDCDPPAVRAALKNGASKNDLLAAARRQWGEIQKRVEKENTSLLGKKPDPAWKALPAENQILLRWYMNIHHVAEAVVCATLKKGERAKNTLLDQARKDWVDTQKQEERAPSVRGGASAPVADKTWLPELSQGDAARVERLRAVRASPAYNKLPEPDKKAIFTYVANHFGRIDAVAAALKNGGPAQEALLANARIEVKQEEQIDRLPPDERVQARRNVAAIREAVDCTSGFDSERFKAWRRNAHAGVQADYDRYFANDVQPVALAPPPLSDRETIDLFLAEYPHPTAKQIVDVLKGKSERNQRDLINRVLVGNFSNSEFGEIDDLARAVQNDPGLRRIVAERLSHQTIQLEARPAGDGTLEDPHRQATICALACLTALARDDRTLGDILTHQSPKGGALFAHALGNGNLPDSGLMSDSRHQVLRALNLNSVAHTATTSAIVFALSEEIVSLDLIGNPRLARSIATAWAREWNPGLKQTVERTRELRREDEQRVARILGTDQGPRLLFGGPPPERNDAAREAVHNDQTITADVFESAGSGDPARIEVVADGMARALVSAAIEKHVPMSDPGQAMIRLAGILKETEQGQELLFGPASPEARALALLAILTHPEITKDVLKTKSDPWQIPQLAMAINEGYAAKFHNTPVTVPGHALKNLVGFYLNARAPGKPITKQDITELPQALENGELPQSIIGTDFFANNEDVEKFCDQVLRYADPKPPEILPLPVTYFSRDTGGPAYLTAFCVRAGINPEDGSPRYVIIDNQRRVYEDSLDDNGHRISCYDNFLRQNDLPSGLLVHPTDLLRTGRNEPFKFTDSDTPETHKTGKHVFRAAALAGAVLATGGVVVGVGGVAGFVLAGIGTASTGYMVYDNFRDKAWLNAHGVDLTGRQALGFWIGTSAMAFGGAGFVGGLGAAGLAYGGAIEVGTARVVAGRLGQVARITNVTAFGQQYADMLLHPGDVTTRRFLETVFFSLGALPHKPLRVTVKPGTVAATPPEPPSGGSPPEPLPRAVARPATPEKSATPPPKASHDPAGGGEHSAERPAETPAPAQPGAPRGQHVWAGESKTLVDTMRQFLQRLGRLDLAVKFNTKLELWESTRTQDGNAPTAAEVRQKIIELAEEHKPELGDINCRGLKNALTRSSPNNPSPPSGGPTPGSGPAPAETPPTGAPSSDSPAPPSSSSQPMPQGGPSTSAASKIDPAAGTVSNQNDTATAQGQQLGQQLAATGTGDGAPVWHDGDPAQVSTALDSKQAQAGSGPSTPPHPPRPGAPASSILPSGSNPKTAHPLPPSSRPRPATAHPRQGPGRLGSEPQVWPEDEHTGFFKPIDEPSPAEAPPLPGKKPTAATPGLTDSMRDRWPRLLAEVPEHLRGFDHLAAQWLSDNNPKAWGAFARWLATSNPDAYNKLPAHLKPEPLAPAPHPNDRDIAEPTKVEPPRFAPRGGRAISPADTITLVGRLRGLLPRARAAEFLNALYAAIKRGPTDKTITVGDFLEAVRTCAETVFDRSTAGELNDAMSRTVADETAGGIVSGELGSTPQTPGSMPAQSGLPKLRNGDTLPLEQLLKLVSVPIDEPPSPPPSGGVRPGGAPPPAGTTPSQGGASPGNSSPNPNGSTRPKGSAPTPKPSASNYDPAAGHPSNDNAASHQQQQQLAATGTGDGAPVWPDGDPAQVSTALDPAQTQAAGKQNTPVTMRFISNRSASKPGWPGSGNAPGKTPASSNAPTPKPGSEAAPPTQTSPPVEPAATDGPSGPGGVAPALPGAPLRVSFSKTRALIRWMRTFVPPERAQSFDDAVRKEIDTRINERAVGGRLIPANSTISVGEFLKVIHDCATNTFGDQGAVEEFDATMRYIVDHELKLPDDGSVLILDVFRFYLRRPSGGPAPGQTPGPTSTAPPAVTEPATEPGAQAGPGDPPGSGKGPDNPAGGPGGAGGSDPKGPKGPRGPGGPSDPGGGAPLGGGRRLVPLHQTRALIEWLRSYVPSSNARTFERVLRHWVDQRMKVLEAVRPGGDKAVSVSEFLRAIDECARTTLGDQGAVDTLNAKMRGVVDNHLLLLQDNMLNLQAIKFFMDNSPPGAASGPGPGDPSPTSTPPGPPPDHSQPNKPDSGPSDPPPTAAPSTDPAPPSVPLAGASIPTAEDVARLRRAVEAAEAAYDEAERGGAKAEVLFKLANKIGDAMVELSDAVQKLKSARGQQPSAPKDAPPAPPSGTEAPDPAPHPGQFTGESIPTQGELDELRRRMESAMDDYKKAEQTYPPKSVTDPLLKKWIEARNRLHEAQRRVERAAAQRREDLALDFGDQIIDLATRVINEGGQDQEALKVALRTFDTLTGATSGQVGRGATKLADFIGRLIDRANESNPPPTPAQREDLSHLRRVQLFLVDIVSREIATEQAESNATPQNAVEGEPTDVKDKPDDN